ncbi:MAG: hypothetical protein AABX70_07305 [Nanoarchaeota archaeon]
MKLFALTVFLLTISMVSAYHTFDYTKNGLAVPGSVNIAIPDVQEVMTSVPGPTLVTRPNNRGVQTFMESDSMHSAMTQPSVRFLGASHRLSVPAHAINPLKRGPGVYLGNYGLSHQYIKSMSTK